MSDITDERKKAAEERAAFYEAAGIEPGEIITTATRLAFSPNEKRSEFQKRSNAFAVPTGQFARQPRVSATLRASRADHGGQDRIRFNGVASVTDTPYTMYDWMGEYDEIVSRSAFTETLATDPDVPLLLNHSGMTMARTKNGSLLLSMGDTGLTIDAYCNPKRSDVMDVMRAVEDGDVDETSFAFMLDAGRWSEDYTQFTITSLNINRGDVSIVNLGANPYTSVAVRTTAILNDLRTIPLAAARKAQEILEDRPDIDKLDRVAEAFAALDREADMARREREFTARGGMTGHEALGRTLEQLEAEILLDEQELER